MIKFKSKVPVLAVAILVASSFFSVTVPVDTAHAVTNGKIVFSTNRDSSGPDTEIYVMNADGSNQTRLTNHPDADDNPVWSPDGTKIAYTAEINGMFSEEIFVMNADGSNKINVSNDAAFIDKTPTWSPDGTKILFNKSQFGPINEIYVVNADGSNPTNLTNQPGNDENPAWSPDGTKIAFTSSRDGNNEIYVMNADGSNQTRLTNVAQNDSVPLWSPDGTKIAFQTNRDGNIEIYVMNADGSNQTNMSNDPGFSSDASWSPDGTKIAFSGSDIFIINADGSNLTNITNYPGSSDWAPVWSPDGTKIAFSTNRESSTPFIYVMNADGSNQVVLGVMPLGTQSSMFIGGWQALADVVTPPVVAPVDPVVTTPGAPNTGIMPATPLWQAIAIGAVGLALFAVRRVYLRRAARA